MRYFFKTYTTIKEHYNNRYWVDNSIVKDIAEESESIQKAIERYKGIVEKECYINISKNAIKKKENIYRDNIKGESMQVGYILTGKTEIENKMVYLDLWIEIYQSVFA